MSSKIVPFYPVYDDLNGSPLNNGFIYVGTAGTNPQILANQINIYWDEALTIPASQPIKTINGYPSRSGSPAAFYASEAEFSVVVLNKNGSRVWTELNAFDDGTRLRNDLASTDTDDGTKGFHLVHYPPLSGETGVVNYEYKYGRAERFGLTGSGDETTKLNNWLQTLADTGQKGYAPNKTYTASGTLTPGGKFHCYFDDTTIQFTEAGTYTDILKESGTDSGVDVAFDLLGSSENIIDGQLTLTTDASDRFVANLAGISSSAATGGQGGSSSYPPRITVEKFDYGLYAAEHDGGGSSQGFPFARTRWDYALIQYCNYGIYSPGGTNAFDEAWVDQLYIRGCYTAEAWVESLYGGSLFVSRRESDIDETETGSISAASNTLTLTAAGDWTNGDVIWVDGAGRDGFGLCTDVTAGGGTTSLTLREAAGTTVSGAALKRNPPDGLRVAGPLVFNQAHFEGYFDKPVNMTNNANVDFGNLEMSSQLGCRGGILIHSANFYGKCSVGIGATGVKSANAGLIIIGPQLLEDGSSNLARRYFEIKSGYDKDKFDSIMNYPIQFVKGVTDGIYSSLGGSYTENNETEDTAILYAGNGPNHYAPKQGSNLKNTVTQAYFSANASNVTGDGTVYTCVFDTEIEDTSGLYNNSTGVITAGWTGKYRICGSMQIGGLTSNNTSLILRLNINSGTRYVNLSKFNPYAINDAGYVSVSYDKTEALSRADTAILELVVSSTDKGVGIRGDANHRYSYLTIEPIPYP